MGVTALQDLLEPFVPHTSQVTGVRVCTSDTSMPLLAVVEWVETLSELPEQDIDEVNGSQIQGNH